MIFLLGCKYSVDGILIVVPFFWHLLLNNLGRMKHNLTGNWLRLHVLHVQRHYIMPGFFSKIFINMYFQEISCYA